MDRRDNRGSFGAPREMHSATCSDCGQETEVPFVPDPDLYTAGNAFQTTDKKDSNS
jgi:hypothetical protein